MNILCILSGRVEKKKRERFIGAGLRSSRDSERSICRGCAGIKPGEVSFSL
jgi:hypothetical protein